MAATVRLTTNVEDTAGKRFENALLDSSETKPDTAALTCSSGQGRRMQQYHSGEPSPRFCGEGPFCCYGSDFDVQLANRVVLLRIGGSPVVRRSISTLHRTMENIPTLYRIRRVLAIGSLSRFAAPGCRAGTFNLWSISTSSSASRSESAADSLMSRSQRSNSCNIFFASL